MGAVVQATGLEWSSSVHDSAQQLMLEHGEKLVPGICFHALRLAGPPLGPPLHSAPRPAPER